VIELRDDQGTIEPRREIRPLDAVPADAQDDDRGPAEGRRTKVALIDDHHLVREGLKLVLATEGFDVVGESPRMADAFDLVANRQPDVVLLDLSLADGDGITLLRELRTRAPDTRVLVVTMHRDAETVRQALLAGAAGYLVKGAHSHELFEAINAVMRGERYLHSSITATVVDDSLRWLQSGGVLTAREREILSLLPAGLAPTEIARRLGISPFTVRRHIANLSDKLGISGTAGLVRYAIREGLVRDSLD
jgi:DNA-binding NarL/FixJ family response regulator